MSSPSCRLTVTLDKEHAVRLSRLAERTHVQAGTLASSLLSSAIDNANPDAGDIATLLDGIPGAYERTQSGLEQGRRGETVSLKDLQA